jgi:hypothetical protein
MGPGQAWHLCLIAHHVSNTLPYLPACDNRQKADTFGVGRDERSLVSTELADLQAIAILPGNSLTLAIEDDIRRQAGNSKFT